jgi:hypothetical protein
VKRLPEARMRFRPDLRTLDDGQENLLSFESELPKLSSLTASTTFEIPLSESESDVFRLTVELIRNRLSVWGQARLRREPSQMKMPLFFENQLPLVFESSGGEAERESPADVSKEVARVQPQPTVIQPHPSPKRRKRIQKS